MSILRFWFFRVLLLGVSFGAAAQDPAPRSLTPDELFAEGTKLYQSSQYAQAAKSYESLARQNPDQAELLLNWGLAEYQAGRRGLGVALWRKALALDPGQTAARSALAFASRAMQLREADNTWLERMRQEVLGYMRLNHLLAVTLILMAAGGWLVFGYLGRRRKALRNELPLPPFNWVGAFISAAFLVMLSLTVLKGIEETVSRGTAIAVTSVRSGPDQTSSSLFELREGSDVVLRQAKKGWTQIRYPGGMSGWVPNETLFQTSGLPIW